MQSCIESYSYSKYTHTRSPIAMRPRSVFSCDVICWWHWHLNLFALSRRFSFFFPPPPPHSVKRWDHSKRELTVALLQTCFIQRWHHATGRHNLPLQWRSCEAEAGLRAETVPLQERIKKNNKTSNILCPSPLKKCSFSRFFFSASGDFSLNFCEPGTLLHILYPPTHTHAHTYTHKLTPVMGFPHG